jgi:hypothetical protein
VDSATSHPGNSARIRWCIRRAVCRYLRGALWSPSRIISMKGITAANFGRAASVSPHAGGNPPDGGEGFFKFYEFRISKRADFGGRSVHVGFDLTLGANCAGNGDAGCLAHV